MEIRELVEFRKEKEGRSYQFIMPKMAPVGEAYDVLFDGLKKVMEISQKNVDSVERKEVEKEESTEA